MSKAVVINGSPRAARGNTAILLALFIEGMQQAGAQVELYYPSRMKIKPCSCSQMSCWYSHPGECSIKDDMQLLYPKLKEVQFLVLATPVYIPLPGAMQDLINRLCPLMEPYLEFRQGRTRGRRRPGVALQNISLVCTSGWWEKENCSTVVRIAEELAEDISLTFGGAALRPHAFVMKSENGITEVGEAVLAAARRAGKELVQDGRMSEAAMAEISRPLISEEALRLMYNDWV
jgi:multimeric flavodoxin WrbA